MGGWATHLGHAERGGKVGRRGGGTRRKVRVFGAARIFEMDPGPDLEKMKKIRQVFDCLRLSSCSVNNFLFNHDTMYFTHASRPDPKFPF